MPPTSENPAAAELLSLDFTVPGAFCEVPANHPARPPASAALKTVTASLSGTLSARVEEPLRQVLKACGQNAVRLDLSRLAAADEQGCALLLAARIKAGARQERHVWLLLLDLCQRLGRERAFRDAAAAYAVSFKLPAPCWDASRVGGCD